MMLLREITVCLVLQITVLYDSVLSRWTPWNTGVDVLSRPEPFQVTFSSRLASLFLRWNAGTLVLDGLARSSFSLYYVVMVPTADESVVSMLLKYLPWDVIQKSSALMKLRISRWIS